MAMIRIALCAISILFVQIAYGDDAKTIAEGTFVFLEVPVSSQVTIKRPNVDPGYLHYVTSRGRHRTLAFPNLTVIGGNEKIILTVRMFHSQGCCSDEKYVCERELCLAPGIQRHVIITEKDLKKASKAKEEAESEETSDVDMAEKTPSPPILHQLGSAVLPDVHVEHVEFSLFNFSLFRGDRQKPTLKVPSDISLKLGISSDDASTFPPDAEFVLPADASAQPTPADGDPADGDPADGDPSDGDPADGDPGVSP